MQQWFLDQWAAYENPLGMYLLEELSTNGQLTVRVCSAASAAEVWALYKITHYLSTAAQDRNTVVPMPRLKLLQTS